MHLDHLAKSLKSVLWVSVRFGFGALKVSDSCEVRICDALSIIENNIFSSTVSHKRSNYEGMRVDEVKVYAWGKER
ncbi:hypothetical protein QJS10_CPB19g01155 [Acorus calamus]|uniref:Uncharacterized protein n=1 Tax=Acorus calamus TaxID=4465 RepID=A0AAV9CKU7_ACOCL|nr:hypothetical protein QJS10_CPB19g01155 [Acorus calamus]